MITEHCTADMEMCYADHLSGKDLLLGCGSVLKTNASCSFPQFCLLSLYPVTELGEGINTGPLWLHVEWLWQPLFTPEFWVRLVQASSGLFWTSVLPLPCLASPHFHSCWFFMNVFQPKLHLTVRFWKNEPINLWQGTLLTFTTLNTHK